VEYRTPPIQSDSIRPRHTPLFTHSIPDPIYSTPGWGSSILTFNNYISNNTPSSGDSIITQHIHHLLESKDHLSFSQICLNTSFAGFAYQVINEFREECPTIGLASHILFNPNIWWNDLVSSIAIAKTIINFDELESLIIPLSQQNSFDLLSSFIDFDALLPLYSTREDSPIIHLQGSFLQNWDESMSDFSLHPDLLPKVVYLLLKSN